MASRRIGRQRGAPGADQIDPAGERLAQTAEQFAEPVVGHAAIPEGDSKDVVITLDTPVATGVSLWPMLHTDAGTIGTYEFPGPDGPVKNGADIVMKKITVTVG